MGSVNYYTLFNLFDFFLLLITAHKNFMPQLCTVSMQDVKVPLKNCYKRYILAAIYFRRNSKYFTLS